MPAILAPNSQTHKEMAALPFFSVLLCPCALLVLLHAPTAASVSFYFDFSSSDYASQLNYSDSAHWANRVIELTKDPRHDNLTTSIGRVWYAQPVPLWDQATRELASFDTTFSFQIKSVAGVFPADGMAFFVSYFPSVTPANSTGGNLGLFSEGNMGFDKGGTATGDDKRRLVAVEFDTYLNTWDPSSSHVGIYVNSIASVAYRNTDIPGRNLSSGFPMVARVTYHNDTTLLSVDLQISNASYNISYSVDMRDFLPETVAVGFSASTGFSAEIHQLLFWSFNSDLELNKKSLPDEAHEANKARKHHLPPERIVLVVVSGLLVLVVACNLRSVSGWCHQQKSASEKQGCGCGPRQYQYSELVKATNNFDQQRKLGRGGSGEVYRGDVNGRLVAVKKLISMGKTTDADALMRRKEFETEVKIISRLRHRFLVRLFGWCDSRKGLLLVYELISGGSLDKYLYSDERPFTWNDRYRVIIGLGKALGYLHGEHSGTKYVVHGDIKPSNIMLDEELNTKLGDFGLARLIEQGAEPSTTETVMGTYGYIEPEFMSTGKRCKESDVYSFGIVLLEMVTGQPPRSQPLRARVWELYAQNTVLDAASATLRSEEPNDEQQMERVLIVGLWCTRVARSERPTIAQAVGILEHADAQLPVLPPCHVQLTATLGGLGDSAEQSRVASPILGELDDLVPSHVYSNTAPVSTTRNGLEERYDHGRGVVEHRSSILN